MHLRKYLVAVGATVAAGALALAPASQATTPTGGPIASVAVGGSTATADYSASLALKAGTSVTMKVFGSPRTLGCTSGSASGTVRAGSPAPNPFMNFSNLTLACESFIPGSTVTISVPTNGCARLEMADSNVNDGLVDTGPKDGKFSVVDGTFVLPAACPVTVVANTCTVTIGGSTPAQFDEAKSTDPVVQNLRLKGNGLTVKSRSAGCFGAVTVGDPLDLTNVNFNVTTSGGAVDFRKSA